MRLQAEKKTLSQWANQRNLGLLGLIALALAIFHHPLTIVLRNSIDKDQYSQILVVLPISALLIYMERRRVFRDLAYNVAGAVLYVVFAGTFLVVAFHPETLDPSSFISLSILLFTACCIAAFLFSYGSEAFRLSSFPLFFLFTMTPWPDSVRERVISFLQHNSGVATDWFFTAANIPFSREDVVITLPTVTIEIAKECSGIRSTLILFLVALVMGHLYLRSGWSKSALMVLLIPVTIARNGLRIFVLSTLGMYVDRSYLTGRLHQNGGIVFFLLAFVVLWGMIWLLQKVESRIMGVEKITSAGQQIATSQS